MIHGNHWESIFGPEYLNKAADALKKTVQIGTPSAPKLYKLKEGERKFKFYTFPEKKLRFLTVGLSNPALNGFEIINSIPFCHYGTEIFLNIDDIHFEEDTFEAVIESSTVDGIKINFYDPLFFLNMDIYMKDTYRIFRISGLAYSLFKTKPESINLFNVNTKEANNRHNFPISIQADKGIAFYNLAHLDNLEFDYNLDDCFVQSFIEELSVFELEGENIYELKLTIGNIEKPIKLIVYAPEKIIEPGYKPQVGDNVYSYIWMQGYSTH
jgi:hypothetical protein